jgi:hypothetical protein
MPGFYIKKLVKRELSSAGSEHPDFTLGGLLVKSSSLKIMGA